MNDNITNQRKFYWADWVDLRPAEWAELVSCVEQNGAKLSKVELNELIEVSRVEQNLAIYV